MCTRGSRGLAPGEPWPALKEQPSASKRRAVGMGLRLVSFKAITDRSLACALENHPKNWMLQTPCSSSWSKPESRFSKNWTGLFNLWSIHWSSYLWWPQMHGLGNQLLYCWSKSWESWKFIGKFVFFCARTSGKIITLLIRSACNLKM